MSLTLTQLRQRLRLAGRNTGDPNYYTTAFLDDALDRLCARFLRVTRCVKTSSSVAFTTANTASFSSLSDFLASRVIRARIDEDANYTSVRGDLDLVSADNVLDRLNCNSSTGTPCLIGFTTSSAATFYPTPKANGTITVVYAALQRPWTMGTRGTYSATADYYTDDIVISSGTLYRAKVANTAVAVATTSTWENLGTGSLTGPDSITSPIPDGLISEIISTGGPPALQAVDAEHQLWVGPAWSNYLQFEAECRGIGSISGKSSTRFG